MAVKELKEEWKDIEGYEGIYQISNYGRVRSLTRYTIQGNLVNGKIRRDYDNGNGYRYIDLYDKNAKRGKHSIHRLVGFAFLENPNNNTVINHKDENRANNYFENLEWCTTKYNVNYGSRNEKHSIARKGKYLSKNNWKSKKVVCLTTNQYFYSIKDASIYFKIPNLRSSISGFCNGTKSNLSHVGTHHQTNEKLVWMYYDNYIEKYKTDKDLILTEVKRMAGDNNG